MTEQSVGTMRDLTRPVRSPKIVSPLAIRIALISGTLFFLITEGIILMIFVRGQRLAFIYNLLFYIAPFSTPLPWLGGLVSYIRIKKRFARTSTDEEVATTVLYWIANSVLLSYVALSVIALLLADFVVHQ